MDEWIEEMMQERESAPTPPTPEQIRAARYARLARVFSQAATGLKRLAIDKPYMRSGKQVDDQYAAYEAMYRAAQAGTYSDAESAAIIAAHEAAESAVAPAVLLMNDVRAKIETMIAADDPAADAMLDAAEAVHLSRDDLTDETLATLRERFGLSDGE